MVASILTREQKAEMPSVRRMENHRSRSVGGPAEPANRSLAAQLALVQERERRRIARGLHDVVGHSLALARMQISQLLASEPAPERQRRLEQVSELLAQAIEETRSLTFELSSLVLSELGLEPALQSLGERIAELRGFRFDFSTDRSPKPLSEDAETILYRLVEELLVNAAKHSRARAIELTMRRVEGKLHIAVEDDGIGFDVSAVATKVLGLGLAGVRQLLGHLGGRLEIDSAPGAGTRMEMIIPLEGETP